MRDAETGAADCMDCAASGGCITAAAVSVDALASTMSSVERDAQSVRMGTRIGGSLERGAVIVALTAVGVNAWASDAGHPRLIAPRPRGPLSAAVRPHQPVFAGARRGPAQRLPAAPAVTPANRLETAHCRMASVAVRGACAGVGEDRHLNAAIQLTSGLRVVCADGFQFP